MIHSTCVVDKHAKISKNVKIGPYSVIGPNVEIGENVEIHSHVNISGHTKIGKGNKIYPFVSINDPQDLKYNGEETKLIIGNNNKIREYLAPSRDIKSMIGGDPNVTRNKKLNS